MPLARERELTAPRVQLQREAWPNPAHVHWHYYVQYAPRVLHCSAFHSLFLFFLYQFFLPAAINEDYEHFAGSMTFTRGRRILPVEVTIINDDTVERLAEETFNVTVSRFPREFGGIKLSDESLIRIVIRDDDSM